MLSQPLLPGRERQQGIKDASVGESWKNAWPSSVSNIFEQTPSQEDKGKDVLPARHSFAGRHPWAHLASLKHSEGDDSLFGASPRHAFRQIFQKLTL